MMELPIITIYNILQTAESLDGIEFYTNDVPEEAQTLPSLPVGRIVELGGSYDEYASNQPNSIDTTVQVDVWVKDITELNKYYYELDRVLRGFGIQCEYTEQTVDPDLEGCRRIIKRYFLSQTVTM